MTAYASAIDDLFADPNSAVEAIYTPAGGDPMTVRVIAKRPDDIVGFGDTRIHTATAVFDIRVSEVPAPAEGDTLEIPGSSPGMSHANANRGFWIWRKWYGMWIVLRWRLIRNSLRIDSA